MTHSRTSNERVSAQVLTDLRVLSKGASAVIRGELLAKLLDEIDRLNKWADDFSNRQLEERRTGEEYQRELRAEIERLRAAVCVLCERDGGVCAMGTHEAEDDPCTAENCSTMRAVGRAHSS